MLQLFSQGTADLLLDACTDYWDGSNLCVLNDSERYVLVYTGSSSSFVYYYIILSTECAVAMVWSVVQLSTGSHLFIYKFLFVLVYSGSCRLMAYTGLFWFLPVYTGLYSFIMVCADWHWSVLDDTGFHWSLLV